MSRAIVVFNAGSSSVKFALYEAGTSDVVPVARGQVEGMTGAPRFAATDVNGACIASREWPAGTRLDHQAALECIAQFLGDRVDPASIAAIGHRVVHGGSDFTGPALLDAPVLERLDALAPLAPLHQPHNLAPVRVIAAMFPGLPQVACFDTAFHSGQAEVARAYALPRAVRERGVRRYGFHGLSYEFISQAMRSAEPARAGGRMVVAHLGSGASMCAMRGGASVATTMGFTSIDGLPMGTRCGSLDAGVVLYLMNEMGMTPAQVQTMLHQQSGLLGVSGISADMRQLLASDTADAKLAVDLFVHRVGRELGSLAAALGGLDTLVFTAGIGEHAPAIRERVCRDAAWLGVELDAESNRAGARRISTPESHVSVWVIPTDEERVIARHAARAVGLAAGAD